MRRPEAEARRWLDQHTVGYRFHDFRKDGLDADLLAGWVDAVGIEALINRQSTTWRNLDAALRKQLSDAGGTAVLINHPTLIKRPVLTRGDTVLIGFSEQRYLEFTATKE